MANFGKRNRLQIIRESAHGFYLDAEALGEILLPKGQEPDWASVGDVVEVFLYRDSEDRPIATTRTPKAFVGRFACLSVKETHPKMGAFLDWGLEKDLLLPFREQKTRVKLGEKVIVFLMIDPVSERIVATSRIHRHLNQSTPDYRPGEAVDLIVFEETPIGYRVIVDNAHTGMLYKSETSSPLDYGQTLEGYVTRVRPDNKIDLRRDPSGHRRALPLSEKIFDRLNADGGYLPFDDKTAPEIVRREFATSKRAFKQALGALYKQRRIEFTDGGIRIAPFRSGSAPSD